MKNRSYGYSKAFTVEYVNNSIIIEIYPDGDNTYNSVRLVYSVLSSGLSGFTRPDFRSNDPYKIKACNDVLMKIDRGYSPDCLQAIGWLKANGFIFCVPIKPIAITATAELVPFDWTKDCLQFFVNANCIYKIDSETINKKPDYYVWYYAKSDKAAMKVRDNYLSKRDQEKWWVKCLSSQWFDRSDYLEKIENIIPNFRYIIA